MTVGLVGLLTTISVFVGAYLGLYYAIPENQRRRLFDLARVLSEAA